LATDQDAGVYVTLEVAVAYADVEKEGLGILHLCVKAKEWE
jgi:hypothetical protein